MHGADGRLLRSIERETRMEVHNGAYKDVAHLTVAVYDGAGAVKVRYREDPRLRVYRLPEAPALSESGQADVAVLDSAAALDKLTIRGADLAPSMMWRILAVPADAQRLADHLYGLTPTLAEGRIGKYGKVVLSADQRQMIWQAMHRADQLVVLQGADPVVLAPGVSLAQWQACVNPGDASEAACP